jgi:NTP pyrophosphatase (non-canonical NTP hydrolase)
MLKQLLEQQKVLLSKFNVDYGHPHTQEDILDQIHHCIEELIEVRRELPKRKNWGTKRYDTPNWDLVKEEAIDAFHFMLNIFILLDMDTEDIYYQYTKKDAENYRRIGEWKQQELDELQEAQYN